MFKYFLFIYILIITITGQRIKPRYPIPDNIEDLPKQPIPCPCKDTSLCAPLNIPPRKEFIGFAVTASDYINYDWDYLTTIVLFEEPDPQMICMAHSHNVRLSVGSEYPIERLGDLNYTQQWIQKYIQILQNNYYDGINFDFEYVVTNQQGIISGLYTGVIAQTSMEMKNVNQNYQISIDVPFSPNCIYDRCYDYFGIAQSSDVLVVMDYDMNLIPNLAQANSPLPNVMEGLLNYTLLGIPLEKIVLALPWYGYDYQCLGNFTLDDSQCQFNQTTTLQRYFYDINNILYDPSIESTGELWDDNSSSPTFNYINSTTNSVHQIWYDNPQSLELKVQFAKKSRLGGVGVWTIDYVNFATQPSLSKLMWDSLNSFFEDR